MEEVRVDRADATRGSALLLGATAIAGGLGYVMQALAGVQLSAAEYASFAVAWAGMFGLAGALAGVQQEIASAARPGAARRPGAVAIVLGVAALPTAALVAAAFALPGATLVVLALAFGVLGATSLLVATGFAYAANAWRLIASTMVLEALLRLVLLQVALLVDAPLPVLVLALALPFALTTACVAPAVLRASRGHGLGTTGRRFAGHVVRTLAATAATAVVVSAFPVFLEAAADASSASEVGAFLYAFTLTRAPFVVVFLALQSFLVRLFQAHLDRVGARLLAALGVLVAVVAAVAVVVALVGPWLLGLVGEDYVLDGWTLLWVVLSAAPMSVLAVTGPLVLAAGLRSAYAIGWGLAALVAVGMVLLLPGDLVVVALVAISVGPVAGAAVHLVAFARR